MLDTVLEIIDLFGKPLGLLVGFLLVVFLVVRPGMELALEMYANRKRRQLEAQLAEERAAKEAELLELLRQAGPKLTDRERIERLARSNPDKAKELVQAWIRRQQQEEAAAGGDA